ncbi:hypothetical protein M758_3G117700 [Ceratodon purpureus]|uniref:Uncharacterized protein n=1 Tax=Ceratodon purpureus TaxID=3225 RepID=A0A8T0IKW6_CERPU|nr:hypothetical protein KC19_3G116300 [Ceratodon purpureus]KAG0622707.1 hypothetical protein M758_3G117700 [Ceratodon purpureus]
MGPHLHVHFLISICKLKLTTSLITTNLAPAASSCKFLGLTVLQRWDQVVSWCMYIICSSGVMTTPK